MAIIGFLAGCETSPAPVCAEALIRANEIADCPEGEIFASFEPHIFCLSPESFILLHGTEFYNYVYGDN